MAQSNVKLPTLLQIPHPSTKLSSRNELNIEGRSSNCLRANSVIDNRTRTRNTLIASVLDEENKKIKEPKGSAKVSCDEMMTMINEKLTTGYHGVKHLFKAHNPTKQGVLNREGFKHVLISLCGYIPPEEWFKVVKKFQLDKNDTISFDEFISYFDKNEKVRKEFLQSKQRVQLIDLNPSTVLSERNLVSNQISAIYCLSLLKARGRSRNFKPSDIIPEECLKNESIILPFHLDKILEKINVSLSDSEFKKLWQKFDYENVGGVRTKVFLRLINYNPNEIDQMTANMDKLRTQSCILSASSNHSKKNKQSYIQMSTNGSNENINIDKLSSGAAKSIKNENNNDNINDKNKKNEVAVKLEIPKPKLDNDNKNEEIEVKPEIVKPKLEIDNKNDQVFDYYNQKPESANRGTSFSETKVRYMVQKFKSSLNFKTSDNLITFMNNKLNSGYIAFRTAFEYIDPDNYGYLLNQEFEAVLKEFDIEFKLNEYSKFLKEHGFIKRNNLINYKAFLSYFNDQSENSITQEVIKNPKIYMKTDEAVGLSAKEADFKLVNLFHGFYLSTLNFFKQSLNTQQYCSLNTFKNLIEKSFSIKITDEQLNSVLKFINNEKANEISWIDFFKKFSEIDPWCYFKDLKDRDGLKTKGKTDVEQQLNALGKIKSKPVEEEPKIQIEKTEAEKPNNEIINKDIELSTKKLPDLKTTETLTVRPLKKIEKLVENLIRTKFHSLNKQFTLLDPKQTECIDRETFLKLAEKCELELNKAEVDLLWKDFHSESVKFSNLVRRFFLPREFSQIRRIRDKIELEKEIEKNQSTHRTYNSSSSCFSELDDECCHHKFNEKNNSKDNLIQQIKPYVSKNWYTLKQDFQIADFAATGYISNSKAMDVFRKNKIQFNNQELEDLCKNFDIEQNSSKFDYITFMKAVNTNKSINEINKTIPKWNSIHPFFEKIIKKIRENLKEKKGLECNLLLRDLNNLKITFKKYDQASKGHLTIQEFKELIKNCQIDVNSEELYQMFAEYDPYLKGVFCYDVFIKKLIDKSF